VIIAVARGNNLSVVREANMYLVIDTIMKYGPVSIEDIVFKTRLSRPTILTLLKEITSENIVYRSGYDESMGGRQAALYSINGSAYYAMGINLDYPPIYLSISDLCGVIIYTCNEVYDPAMPAEEVLENMIALIESSIAKAGIDRHKLIGLGLGIPGTVNTIHNTSGVIDRLPGWDKLDIKNAILERTRLNTFLRNDVDLAGFSEMKLLPDKVDNMLYIVNSTGVGMAIFIKGRIYGGQFGNAGYLGHTCIDIDGEKCYCGKKGCAEIYCSQKNSDDEYSSISFPLINERASAGDHIAQVVLTKAARAFGTVISNAVLQLDIPFVVIGGLSGCENTWFFELVQEIVAENTRTFSMTPVELRCGALPINSWSIGGCQFVIDDFFKRPKLTLTV
jgi:predicted NBD/HSP70 family sugar kinase